jgi:uncharacterized protein (TIGR02147 family)
VLKSIYEYLNPLDFLRDHLKERQDRNPRFSLRAWAKLMGLEGHTPVHQILAGKRAIPKKYLPQIVAALNLNCHEAMYF